MKDLDPRIRSGLTILVMTLMLFGGGAWAWKASTAPLPAAPQPDNSLCHDKNLKAGDKLTPEMVTISVFNSGTRAGLASRALGQFTDQGFGAGKVGNAPDAGVKVAEIWAADPSDPAVKLVASRLPNAEINEGPALGPGIVVVVGDKFSGLAKGSPSVEVADDATVCEPTPKPAS